MAKRKKQSLTPHSPFGLWAQVARMSAESQLVIGLRVAGMMGLISLSANEPFRMVVEKQEAASESFYAMAKAASRGASADHVMSAALRPYAKRTAANTRRLTNSV